MEFKMDMQNERVELATAAKPVCRLLAAAFLALASEAQCAGTSASAAEIPAGMQFGVTFGFYAPGGYMGSEAAMREIDAIAAAGANWVTVVPIVWQDSWSSDFQYKDFALSQSDLDLKDAIDYIHSKGMKVQLRPMLECKDGIGRLGVWLMKDRERMKGRVCRYRTNWFRSMKERSVYYARIAERTKCEVFCIDSELDKMVEENEKWKAVVSAVREVYSGPVTSCHTLHTGDVDFLGFLADKSHWFYDLDFLSISYYCAARGNDELDNDLSVDDMKARLGPALGRMRAIAAAYGRPLLFGECGCTSCRAGASSPSAYTSKEVDEEEQARYMDALFGVFAKEPWCLGFHWWKWDQHSPPPNCADPAQTRRFDFTIKGKKAEAVFRRWSLDVKAWNSNKGANNNEAHVP